MSSNYLSPVETKESIIKVIHSLLDTIYEHQKDISELFLLKQEVTYVHSAVSE